MIWGGGVIINESLMTWNWRHTQGTCTWGGGRRSLAGPRHTKAEKLFLFHLA